MSEASEFIQLLSTLGPLDWYRFVDGRSDPQRLSPPPVVWRFIEPGPPSFDKPIERVIDSPTRCIEWYFYKRGRNWVLTPKRVVDEQTANSLPTDTIAISTIADKDQEFCAIALNDLGRIVSELTLGRK